MIFVEDPRLLAAILSNLLRFTLREFQHSTG